MTQKAFLAHDKSYGGVRQEKKNLALLRRREASEYDWFKPSAQCTPEKQLAVAVMQRAILDLLTKGISSSDKQNAYDWICGEFGRDFEENYEFSFSRIVGMFSEMNPDEFRHKVLCFIEEAHGQKTLADNFRFQRGKKHTKRAEEAKGDGTLPVGI